MISLDAASSADAKRLFALPNLSRLWQQSARCTRVNTIYPTITYPIHASLLTGCYPEKHGIYHNQPFQGDVPPALRKWYWEVGQIRAKTLYQAAWEKGMDVASVLWPVSGKNPYTRRNFPEVAALPGENAALKMLAYGTPWWVLQTEIRHGKKRQSIRQPHLDRYAALLCEQLYASRRPPDVLLVHLVDLDSMRHQYGVNSPEAMQAMERMDENVGRILQAIQTAGLWEETCICLVSDHGHQDAPNGVLLDAVLKKHTGCRAQTMGRGAYIFGDDLAKARRYMEENRQALGIDAFYDAADMKAFHGPSHVQLAVSARPGVCFLDDWKETRGEHGFSLNCEEAKTLFLLSGPGVKPGDIPEMDLVQIAPTLAWGLGLSLPDAQGAPRKDIWR